MIHYYIVFYNAIFNDTIDYVTTPGLRNFGSVHA